MCLILTWLKLCCSIHFLPNEKNLDKSKFKAFADDSLYVNQKLKFAFGRVEKIVRKGEKCW